MTRLLDDHWFVLGPPILRGPRLSAILPFVNGVQTPRARQGSILGCRNPVWTTPWVIPLKGRLLCLHTVTKKVGSTSVTTRNTVLALFSVRWASRHMGTFMVVVLLK